MPVNVSSSSSLPSNPSRTHRRSPTEFSFKCLTTDQQQKIEATLENFNDSRNVSPLRDHRVKDLGDPSRRPDISARHRRTQSSIPNFTSGSLQSDEELKIEHLLSDFDFDLLKFKDFRAFYSDVVKILDSKGSFEVTTTDGKRSKLSLKSQRNTLIAKISLKTALVPLVLINSGVWKAVDGARSIANRAVVAFKKVRDPLYVDSKGHYPHPYYRNLADEKERLRTAQTSISTIYERLNKLIKNKEEMLKPNQVLRALRDTQVEKDAITEEQIQFKTDLRNANIEIDNFSEKLTQLKADLRDPKIKIDNFQKELEIAWKLSKLSSNPKKLENKRNKADQLTSSIENLKKEIRLAAITHLFQSENNFIKNLSKNYRKTIFDIIESTRKIKHLETKIRNLYLLPRNFTIEGTKLDIVKTQITQEAINMSANENHTGTSSKLPDPIKVQISILKRNLADMRTFKRNI